MKTDHASNEESENEPCQSTLSDFDRGRFCLELDHGRYLEVKKALVEHGEAMMILYDPPSDFSAAEKILITGSDEDEWPVWVAEHNKMRAGRAADYVASSETAIGANSHGAILHDLNNIYQDEIGNTTPVVVVRFMLLISEMMERIE